MFFFVIDAGVGAGCCCARYSLAVVVVSEDGPAAAAAAVVPSRFARARPVMNKFVSAIVCTRFARDDRPFLVPFVL